MRVPQFSDRLTLAHGQVTLLSMDKINDANFDKINWDKVREIFAPEKESFLKQAKEALEKYPQAEDALRILAGAGALGMMVLMPPLGVTVGRFARNDETRRYRRMWRRWEKQKLVTIRETPEGTVVEITQEGIKKALKYKLGEMAVKKPIAWDGKWRVAIFDVSEKRKRSRDYFCRNLRHLGFVLLNKSVWVYPYSCFDEVEFLRQISGVGDEVTYLTADSI